jgi:hypothetical protein
MFDKIGCASCHATLPLTADNNPGLPSQPGWMYFEPNRTTQRRALIHRICNSAPRTTQSALRHSLST